MDPLEGVFVFCFVFGVATSLFSFVLGALHGVHGIHLGDGGHGGGHGAGGHGHTLHAGGDDHGDRGALHEGHFGETSPFNLQTITAFMAFFGGAGWVLYGSAGLGAAVALILATVVGLAGGSVVFWFLVKVLVAGQQFMDPSETRMEGTVARVTIPIQDGRVGEIIFAREGSRRSEGARSATGEQIARGTEVVIVRYEGGLAYVEPWATYTGESEES
jgi:hypothetical protein